jgi:hypothetical protein
MVYKGVADTAEDNSEGEGERKVTCATYGFLRGPS